MADGGKIAHPNACLFVRDHALAESLEAILKDEKVAVRSLEYSEDGLRQLGAERVVLILCDDPRVCPGPGMDLLQELCSVQPAATLLVFVASPFSKEQLGHLHEAKVAATFHAPYRLGLVGPTLRFHLERPQGDLFKRCSFCGRGWQSRTDLLEDKQIELIGYQAIIGFPERGLFMFNDLTEGCKTTLAIPVGRFLDLYSGPRFSELHYLGPSCSGRCLDGEELGRCAAPCLNAAAREIAHMLTARSACPSPLPAQVS